MGRRLVLACVLLGLLPAAPGSASPAPSWAQAEIKAVLSAGLVPGDAVSFRPQDPLTRGTLETLVAGLTHAPPTTPASPDAPVTMAGLDSRLVTVLGLADTAKLFVEEARSAGLAPPPRFGTEIAARLLGLRTNHPASQDDLELLPSEPATRAEAAYSAARILRFRGNETQGVHTLAEGFALPPLSVWQKRILSKAVSFIGYPYVWGGESESQESPFGLQAHGGFDCSGFVWRVYKLQSYPGAGSLADTLRGRTTFAMSGEVPRSKRIPMKKLQPADVVFFGARGPRSKAAQVDHMGIYLGNGWFVHSSSFGVALANLSGWYQSRFAWGRRPLAEARLGLGS